MVKSEIKKALSILGDRVERSQTAVTDNGLCLTVFWSDGGQHLFYSLNDVEAWLDSKQTAMSAPVNKRMIGLTDLACKIADDHATAQGLTRSEWLEWVILCQQFPTHEAESLWSLRRQRGGRGGVHVVPDECELPEV